MRYKSFAYVILLVSFLITYTMLPDTASAITYNISGTVSLSGFTGSGLAGVTMTLSGDASKTATTGSLGTYSFTGLSNGTYTVTPGKTGYIFDPTSNNVTISGASQNGVDFTAYPTYSISGTVIGAVQEGVVMTLYISGVPTIATTTDSSGSYSFTDLSSLVRYTITPSKTGYAFDPPSKIVMIINANQTNVNFTSSFSTYSISGTVSGEVKAGVTMTLSGVASKTATTSASGTYTFSGLLNGSYTITPSKTNYSFVPASIPITIADDNQTGVNFTAYGTNYSISGQVTGDIKEGVTITLSGDPSQTTTTNSQGIYSLTGLMSGNYIVTPSKTGYAFDPLSRAVTISGEDQNNQDFVATVAGNYSISGTVSGAVQEGVTMTLSGTASKTTTTDSDGFYSFAGLINGTYTVTPSKSGYTFEPASRSVTISGGSVVGKDFVASSTAIYSISGKVTGDTPADVTITLSGNASQVTTTDTAGNYSFTELANGDYLVTPSKAGYTFSPSFTSVSIHGKSQTNVNFTASVEGTYSISGTVTGGVQGDIIMNLSGPVSKTTTTDSDGFYSFSGLSNDTSYIITPSKSGYTFTPSSRTVPITNSSVTGADFTASVLPTYSISGTVTLSGSGLSGVTLTLSVDASQTTTTNTLGNYTISGLSNGTYTITPSKSGYTFSPENTSVTIIDAPVTGIDFIASAACATWGDVIASYNEYVSGNKTWFDVISTYNQYVTQPCQ